MKKNQLIYLMTALSIFYVDPLMAQEISFKTELLGSSGYYYLPPGDNPREKIGNGTGSASVYQASVNLPLSVKKNGNVRPTIWGLGIGGAYASLTNRQFSQELVSDIMNLQVGLYHLRPLNEQWSLRASIGLGAFAATTNLSLMSFKNLLGSGGIVFIRHLKQNIDIGGGVAINSSLGYPMIFPAVYLKWRTKGRFDVNIELIDGLDISAGYDFNEKLRLSYAIEMNGQVALLQQDNQDMIFSHQYIVTGFRPVLKFKKTKLTLIGMAGLNLYRPASYSERTLRGVFASDNDYYFSVSTYAAIGLKLKL